MKFSVRRIQEECIALAILATAIGIAEDQQKGVFDAFRQLTAPSAEICGMYRCLSISRELARLFGGSDALSGTTGGQYFYCDGNLVYDVTIVPSRQLAPPRLTRKSGGGASSRSNLISVRRRSVTTGTAF